MGAVVLALMLLTQPADALTVCEAARRANLDDALTWEGRAHEARIHHRACLDRLTVRTSTPTPAVVEFRAIESPLSPTALVLGGLAVFLGGTITGLLVAQALR